MFRTMITSGMLAAGALTGLTPSPADAHPPAMVPVPRPVFVPSNNPPAGHDHHDRIDFQVLVWHRGHWYLVETFRDRDDAQRLAHRLRHRGEEVDIRPVR